MESSHAVQGERLKMRASTMGRLEDDMDRARKLADTLPEADGMALWGVIHLAEAEMNRRRSVSGKPILPASSALPDSETPTRERIQPEYSPGPDEDGETGDARAVPAGCSASGAASDDAELLAEHPVLDGCEQFDEAEFRALLEEWLNTGELDELAKLAAARETISFDRGEKFINVRRVSTLVRRLAATTADLIDQTDAYDRLGARLSAILTGTANALKGEPKPLHSHSWHDLPEIAASLRAQHAPSPHSPARVVETAGARREEDQGARPTADADAQRLDWLTKNRATIHRHWDSQPQPVGSGRGRWMVSDGWGTYEGDSPRSAIDAAMSSVERSDTAPETLAAAVQQDGATDAEAKDDADLLNRVYHMRTVEGGHELPLTGRALLANLRLHEDLKRTATTAGRGA